MRLYERWRPKCLDDVVGQPKAVDQVRRIIDSKETGSRALWISGPTSSGKTSLSKILAHWKPAKGTAAVDARIARQYTNIAAMGVLAFPGAT